MKRKQLIILTLLLSSCSIGKQSVYYNEMESPPKVTITDHSISIETKNSIKHSALKLYKIETEVNKEKKELNLRGLQAANKKYKADFEMEFDKIGIDDIEGWTIIWIDPDGTKREVNK